MGNDVKKNLIPKSERVLQSCSIRDDDDDDDDDDDGDDGDKDDNDYDDEIDNQNCEETWV